MMNHVKNAVRILNELGTRLTGSQTGVITYEQAGFCDVNIDLPVGFGKYTLTKEDARALRAIKELSLLLSVDSKAGQKTEALKLQETIQNAPVFKNYYGVQGELRRLDTGQLNVQSGTFLLASLKRAVERHYKETPKVVFARAEFTRWPNKLIAAAAIVVSTSPTIQEAGHAASLVATRANGDLVR